MLKVENLDGILLKDINVGSVKKINVHLKLFSLLTKDIRFNLILENPDLVVDKDLLDGLLKRREQRDGYKFNIEQIKIKNGRARFQYKNTRLKINNLNISSVRNQDRIIVYFLTPYFEVELPLQKSIVKLKGRLTGKLFKDKGTIELASTYWRTDDFNVKLSGTMEPDRGLSMGVNFSGNPEGLFYPILKDFNASGYVTGRFNVSKRKEDVLRIKGRFKAPSLKLGNQPLTNIRGEADWNALDKRVNLRGFMKTGRLNAFFTVNSEKGKTLIKVKNVMANMVAKLVSLYKIVPFGGIVDTGTIELQKKRIFGEVLLKKSSGPDSEFNVDGLIDFNLNKPDKILSFSSQRLMTEFGEFAVEGQHRMLEKGLSIKARAKISEMRGIEKYAKFFINLDLARWNLRQGAGYFSLNLEKRDTELSFRSQMLAKDFITNEKTIDSMNLDLKKDGPSIQGKMDVDDPHLKTNIDVRIDKNKTEFTFRNVSGLSEKIFKILDIPSPMTGNIEGSCVYTLPTGAILPSIEGTVTGKKVMIGGFDFFNISSHFRSNIESLDLKDMKFTFMDGAGQGKIYMNFKESRYDVKGDVKGLNVSKIYYAFIGKGDVTFDGRGRNYIDPIQVKYHSDKTYFYENRNFSFRGEGKILTDFYNFDLTTTGRVFNEFVKSKPFISTYSMDLKKRDLNYSGNYSLNLSDINLVMPWENHSGSVIINGMIQTRGLEILSSGVANFNGTELSLPNFPHAIENYSGFISFNNTRMTLNTLTGTLGGGQVDLNGYMNYLEGVITRAKLNMTGKEMLVYPMSRTQFKLNGDVVLNYLNEQLSLEGNLNVLSGVWEREITEGVEFYTPSKMDMESSELFNNINLNLRLAGRKNIQMSNAFGKINGSFDLNIQGTPLSPIVLGIIEGTNGEIYFSDKKFKLLKAKLLYNNRLEINPDIIMESEAFIKNYRIKFNSKGTVYNPIPELKSSPPLPQEEILALISLGELFEKQRSMEFSSQIGSTSLMSQALLDQVQKRAQKFGIDLLRIDTRLSKFTTDTSPRLTVGTSILKDVLIVYSTNITGLRREVVYFQYQLSPAVSLIGMRNESGKFSLDIRFRKKD